MSINAGGTGFIRAVAANTRQVRDDLKQSGTPSDLDLLLEIVEDPDTHSGHSGVTTA